MEPIVDAAWLTDNVDSVVVADVRWYLRGGSGSEAYARGHIPGAVFVDLPSCLAGEPAPERGRHPLPEPEAFARCMSDLGIGDGTAVVAYDDTNGSSAARLVWMLRVLGEQAALLDGGIQAWEGPKEAGAGADRPAAQFTARPWPEDRLADIDEVAKGDVILLDARDPERYRGDNEPVDPRAGHIPGAMSAPWPLTLDAAGRFLPAVYLRKRFEAAGVPGGPGVVASCGSGVNACHLLVAMEFAGLEPSRLYPGSFSQWSSDPSRPVATGDEP